MAWLKRIENIPLTVFAFYLTVLFSVTTRTLNLYVVILSLGILFVHYLFKYIQIKESQIQQIKDFQNQVNEFQTEIMSLRTDISKLNLMFGAINNPSGSIFRRDISTPSSKVGGM